MGRRSGVTMTVLLIASTASCLFVSITPAEASPETPIMHNVSGQVYPLAGGVRPVTVLLIGATVGFLTSLFGAGGGFLMTPLLLMAGVPAPVAVATDAANVTAGSSGGAMAHTRMANVDYLLAGVSVTGGLLGGSLGVQTVRILIDSGQFDFLLRLVFCLILGSVGLALFIEGARTLRGMRHEVEPKPSRLIQAVRSLPMQVDFRHSGIRSSVLVPGCAGVVDGLLIAFIGVGGGFLMLPVLIYIIGVPTRVAVGTMVFQTVFVAGCVTFQHAVVNRTVDIVLMLTLFAGSVAGSRIGIFASRCLKGEQVRVVLAAGLVLAMFMLLVPMLQSPEHTIGLLVSRGVQP